ncbi:MAG: hypothetical protein GX113_03665 [Actinobacteria bacterium]|nr:hypothetical protein [Actinomycetota bacterium]
MDWKTMLVVHLVVGARVLLPLVIPRYPLWGILACMILDSADQSILEAFGVVFPRYQSYDKALDIYYLAVAYLATMRNWENLAAFQVGRVLFYLRLLGVLAFELTEARWLLFVFPNAFEAFFVYYEIVRRRGNPRLLTRNALLVVVAVIWFVLKLPHEWWVHIAKLDATDFVKTHILGAPPSTSFWRAIIEAPAVTGSLTLIAAILALAAWHFAKKRKRRTALNRTLHGATANDAGSLLSTTDSDVAAVSAGRARRTLRVSLFRYQAAFGLRVGVLVEKVALVSAVSVIFGQILPGMEANGIRTAFFVSLTVVIGDFLLRWTLRRFMILVGTWVDVSMMAVLNFFFVLLFQFIIPYAPRHNLAPALIFASLITLFVALYDGCRPIYDVREADTQVAKRGASAPSARGY